MPLTKGVYRKCSVKRAVIACFEVAGGAASEAIVHKLCSPAQRLMMRKEPLFTRFPSLTRKHASHIESRERHIIYWLVIKLVYSLRVKFDVSII